MNEHLEARTQGKAVSLCLGYPYGIALVKCDNRQVVAFASTFLLDLRLASLSKCCVWTVDKWPYLIVNSRQVAVEMFKTDPMMRYSPDLVTEFDLT